MSEAKALVDAVAAEVDASAAEPMPAGSAGVRPNKAVTVSTRIAASDAEAVEEFASELGVRMAALLRG